MLSPPQRRGWICPEAPRRRNRSRHHGWQDCPKQKVQISETRSGAEVPIVSDTAVLTTVHMIRLTPERETVPYVRVHPDDER